MISLDCFKQYKDLSSILYFIQRNALLLFAITTIFIFLLAGWTFYQYAYKPSFREFRPEDSKDLRIDHELYQKLLYRTEEKEQNFRSTEKHNFPDPFQ